MQPRERRKKKLYDNGCNKPKNKNLTHCGDWRMKRRRKKPELAVRVYSVRLGLRLQFHVFVNQPKDHSVLRLSALFIASINFKQYLL